MRQERHVCSIEGGFTVVKQAMLGIDRVEKGEDLHQGRHTGLQRWSGNTLGGDGGSPDRKVGSAPGHPHIVNHPANILQQLGFSDPHRRPLTDS